MKKSAIPIFVIFSTLILVNLPVYGDSLGGEYNYSNTPPKNTHVCNILPDGREDCLDEHFKCNVTSFNMTTRQPICLQYFPIPSRWICSKLPDGGNDCLSIGINATIPPIIPLETRPMNMSNSTVSTSIAPMLERYNFVSTNEITITQGRFSPSTIQVTPGTTITWMNNDTVPHRIMSGTSQGSHIIFDGITDSGILQPRQSFQFTVNDLGIIKFYDWNTSMSGIISVSNTPIITQQNNTFANSTSIVTNLVQNTTALNDTFNAGPTWVKKVFSWYESGQLNETELFSFVKWMIDNKIMGR